MDEESADHDSPGVDHRVMRHPFAVEGRGVEPLSTWLFAHVSMHFLADELVQIGIGNYLPDGLDGEFCLEVPDLRELTVDGAQGGGE